MIIIFANFTQMILSSSDKSNCERVHCCFWFCKNHLASEVFILVINPLRATEDHNAGLPSKTNPQPLSPHIQAAGWVLSIRPWMGLSDANYIIMLVRSFSYIFIFFGIFYSDSQGMFSSFASWRLKASETLARVCHQKWKISLLNYKSSTCKNSLLGEPVPQISTCGRLLIFAVWNFRNNAGKTCEFFKS